MHAYVYHFVGLVGCLDGADERIVKLYYDSACSVPAPGFTGIVGQCVQGNQPFVSAEVFCP
jgi:hypothetical protein